MLRSKSSAVREPSQEVVEDEGMGIATLDARDRPDADGDVLATLDWVATALGWADEGIRVSRLDCPGPRAWGIFSWAMSERRARRDFFALWTNTHKRAAAPDDREAAIVAARQIAEMEAMLRELAPSDG